MSQPTPLTRSHLTAITDSTRSRPFRLAESEHALEDELPSMRRECVYDPSPTTHGQMGRGSQRGRTDVEHATDAGQLDAGDGWSYTSCRGASIWSERIGRCAAWQRSAR